MIRTASWFAALALTACAGVMPQGAGSPPVTVADGVLVNASGMTLYTFDKDPVGANKSVCNGPCAANWPPLAVGADARPAQNWSVITRDDGSRQWAYQGKPVYLWIKDQRAGDRTGDGFNGVWHLARP
jgi:predicted lipoprotein with Yx(FWY)xxD motif